MTKHALIDRIYGSKANARFWLAIDRLRAAMCQEEQRQAAEQQQGQSRDAASSPPLPSTNAAPEQASSSPSISL